MSNTWIYIQYTQQSVHSTTASHKHLNQKLLNCAKLKLKYWSSSADRSLLQLMLLLRLLLLPFYGSLSRTTQVSWYQKKHSPAHTYCDHQSSYICFLHLLWPKNIVPVQFTHTDTHRLTDTHTHTHNHLQLSGLCPGQPGWARTRRYISLSSGFSGAKCLTVFLHNLSPSLLWSGTLHFILHTFLHQVFFLQQMPISMQPVLL